MKFTKKLEETVKTAFKSEEHFLKNIKEYAIQRPMRTGMKIGGRLAVPLSGVAVGEYLHHINEMCNEPMDVGTYALVGFSVAASAIAGYLIGHVVPGIPIGIGIWSTTKKPKPYALIREQNKGYSIEEAMPIQFEREQKGIMPMFNDSNHYVFKEEFGKYLINNEEHTFSDNFGSEEMKDRLIYYANGAARWMLDIKDTEEEAKKACLDHLLENHDLTKMDKIYFMKKDSNEWTEYDSKVIQKV